ncbi:MoaD/ThiS family protein [Nitrogeniibacter mangrovi]|uniref:MoaD/ThiS family protein n=1 Tax=Nitrogeniibacter mangrovi TaxID=2016596 RepID=A0A6C1B8N6_9RHOO|nr:MoaD/ThiS family protein [Nitrogeniibacter mangrovi]QID18614.1 MoaD/ThiS family protein [Nitrogeniibacter mangrovi]
MKVAFKLFATLTDYLPPDRKGNVVTLDVDEGTRVQDLIDRYQVPEKLAHLVLVNGVFIPPQQRRAHALKDNDELAVWPPVAGG